MSYGFRLFTFKLVKGVQGQRKQPFQACGADGKTHAADHLVRLLRLLEGYQNLSKMPPVRAAQGDVLDPIDVHTVIPDTELQRGDPKVRWLTSEISASRLVSVTFRYGTVGREEIAMSSSGPDSDIKGKAPAQEYRADFYFPAEGEVGILALEAIDNTNPIRVLTQWLTRAAIEVRDQDTVSTGVEGDVWRLSFNPLADYPKLRTMILRSPGSEIRLFKHEVSGEGVRTTQVTKVKVEAKITEEAERELAVDWATTLYERAHAKFLKGKPRRKRGAAAPTKEELAAAETAALEEKRGLVAELENIVDSVSGLGFDDGVLVLRDENNTVTKIGPDRLDDVFVYRITENIRPDEVQWRQAVERVIVDQRTALNTEIVLGET